MSFGEEVAEAYDRNTVHMDTDAAVGLRLRERWADWERTTFTGASRSHVSVYGR